jgi:antitoxin MazE
MTKRSTVTAEIVSIGNSKGVRIPKAIREQVGLEGRVTLTVADDGLIIRPARKPREGWAERYAALDPTLTEEDKAWLEMPDDISDDEWTW